MVGCFPILIALYKLCYIHRPQYYKLVEECVTQIVLHRSGVDPDFRHTKRFVIDVEPLLSEQLPDCVL